MPICCLHDLVLSVTLRMFFNLPWIAISLLTFVFFCSWADFHYMMQRGLSLKPGTDEILDHSDDDIEMTPLPAHVAKGIQEVMSLFSSQDSFVDQCEKHCKRKFSAFRVSRDHLGPGSCAFCTDPSGSRLFFGCWDRDPSTFWGLG